MADQCCDQKTDACCAPPPPLVPPGKKDAVAHNVADTCCSGGVPAFDGMDPRYTLVLWTVIAINGAMFLTEMIAGQFAGSRALQADALDFLGDTITYGLSLAVIGASSARLLIEVARRERGGQLDTVAAIVGEANAALDGFAPNNPAGVVYSEAEIRQIAALAGQYGATVIADQLYSRLRYSNVAYTHLRATGIDPANVITIMGPSKTESLSGYRLGVAFGAPKLIERMEKLQAIVSLRAAGYNQAVLQTWFAEPEGWMDERIRLHQAIRDDLLKVLRAVEGIEARTPQAGSYLFPSLPALAVATADFVRVLRHQAGVVVTPGTEFGPHSASSVRLNFSQDHAAAVNAVERMVELVGRYRA